MQLIIHNEPDYARNYEFVVVKEINGEYWFNSAHADGFVAERVASSIGGIIVHNLRIQGIRREEDREK